MKKGVIAVIVVVVVVVVALMLIFRGGATPESKQAVGENLPEGLPPEMADIEKSEFEEMTPEVLEQIRKAQQQREAEAAASGE